MYVVTVHTLHCLIVVNMHCSLCVHCVMHLSEWRVLLEAVWCGLAVASLQGDKELAKYALKQMSSQHQFYSNELRRGCQRAVRSR